MSEHPNDDLPRPAWLGPTRLGLGLAQGLALYALCNGPTPPPVLGAILLLVFSLVPPLVVAALGHMRGVFLGFWALLVMLVVSAIGLHAGLDQPRGQAVATLAWLPLAVLPALFVAHNLAAAAEAAHRPRAPYPAYFDLAWKTGLQFALAGLFCGLFWLLLKLGAALFSLIGLDGPQTLLGKPWFALPLTGATFTLGVHLADARASLTRGLRVLLHNVLAWLLVLLAPIVLAFLLALPFTGLAPLWATKHAAALLLATAAVLVQLINAAYQDGTALPPRVMAWAGRVAALVLVPLVALAGWALALRIGQYGLTPQRVLAGAATLLAAGYALGYAAAALRPGRWLAGLEPTNLLAALAAVLVTIGLLTPLADPYRLAVANQLRRLDTGRTSAEAFDYQFLRFSAGRHGTAALAALAQRSTGPEAQAIASHARAAQQQQDRYAGTGPPEPAQWRITLYPAGTPLPEALARRVQQATQADRLGRLGPCFTGRQLCEAFHLDLDADGMPELVILHGHIGAVFQQVADGSLRVLGGLDVPWCGSEPDARRREALRQGQFRRVAPAWQDIELGGLRLRLAENCPPP